MRAELERGHWLRVGAAGAQWSQTQITVLSMFTTVHVLQIVSEKIFTTDILKSILDLRKTASVRLCLKIVGPK